MIIMMVLFVVARLISSSSSFFSSFLFCLFFPFKQKDAKNHWPKWQSWLNAWKRAFNSIFTFTRHQVRNFPNYGELTPRKRTTWECAIFLLLFFCLLFSITQISCVWCMDVFFFSSHVSVYFRGEDKKEKKSENEIEKRYAKVKQKMICCQFELLGFHTCMYIVYTQWINEWQN